jgi:hypothetical protein
VGVWSSLQLTDSTTIEGFYLTNWDKIRIDPRGSTSRTTTASPMTATARSFIRAAQGPALSAHQPDLRRRRLARGPVARVALRPVRSGRLRSGFRATRPQSERQRQYGVALRYLAKDFNNTEFGLYFMNYHSRTPFVSGKTGTAMGGTTTLTSSSLPPATRPARSTRP